MVLSAFISLPFLCKLAYLRLFRTEIIIAVLINVRLTDISQKCHALKILLIVHRLTLSTAIVDIACKKNSSGQRLAVLSRFPLEHQQILFRCVKLIEEEATKYSVNESVMLVVHVARRCRKALNQHANPRSSLGQNQL